MKISKRSIRVAVGLALLTFVALVVAGTVSAARSATPTVTIWVDADRKPAVDKVASAWAATRGVQVNIVQKQFGDIRTDLSKVQADTAPDVIVGAHDWVGELSANGLLLPLNPRRAIRDKFPTYALDAFSYATATGAKRLYGAPVSIENIGLVTNTKLAKVPTTFAELQKNALAFKAKKKGNLALAVQQGANGDTYHMQPLFAGLCGYIFGKDKNGNLNPKDIGVANPKFLANAKQIDAWNKVGFVNSKVDDAAARTAFLEGRAAYWITGPWNTDVIKKAGIKFQVSQVPQNSCKSVPFLGVNGFMVTKFSQNHGVETAARDLVSNYMMQPAPQFALASANGRYPANVDAGKLVKDATLKQFGTAGKGGVPMPNIPQMASVWSDTNAAWVKSTKGAGATRARVAFTVAARNIANKIG